jgi:predicted nucleic acid-binding protein
LVEVTETIEASRDPDDDKFLELAVAGEAGIVVSGGKGLLVLDPFQDVRIVRPRAFVEDFPPAEETLQLSVAT